MRILDDLIASLEEDSPVDEVRTCVFWTAVVSKHCGLASTMREVGPHGERQVREVGSLQEKSALELAQYAKSDLPLEASIGMASINSLLEVDESRCVELNARDLLLEQGQDKKIAIVGHFPFLAKLKGVAESLWVLERYPAKEELPAEAAEEVLPQADLVAITGTTLINHTLDHLLSLCRPDSLVMLLGPTTPLSPVLFDHGVDIISGTRVIDAKTVLHCISQGATFQQVKGVRLLTMIRETP
ncbi:MAG: Rossmann-like domain-containing protein [Anaerolineae bacterium]